MNEMQTLDRPQISATDEALHGLSCPQCAGIVPVPEGQVIVACPYCGLHSLVRGERGLRRYQVPLRIDRSQPGNILQDFFRSHMAIARNASRRARMEEEFVVFLPFWVKWARVLGWVFGSEKVGSGKNTRYEPREVKVAQEMTWNGAACDVGEFGVDRLPLTTQPMEPFNPDELHNTGLVFEPVGSISDAETMADQNFEQRVKNLSKIDRITQSFIRYVRARLGLVYYPLWVIRYLYRGRSFQVVADGYTGKVLYGKAPGNTLYRAAALVIGMALGAFALVDIPAVVLRAGLGNGGDDSEGVIAFALIAMGIGVILIRAGYRRFRYGEVFEYRGHRKQKRKRIRRKEGRVRRAWEEEG